MIGDTAWGACAEFVSVDAGQLIALPDDVDAVAASCLPVAYGTAQRMLVTRGQLRAGESVLILGASGGVGTACVLLAMSLGADVTAVASSAERCACLQALGADRTVDSSEEDIVEHTRRTTGRLFSGGGYDVVVNFTGGDTWAKSLRCAKKGGRVLTCGATAGFDPPTDLRYIWTGELDVRGSDGWEREDLHALLGARSGGAPHPRDRPGPPARPGDRRDRAARRACGLRQSRDRAVIRTVPRPASLAAIHHAWLGTGRTASHRPVGRGAARPYVRGVRRSRGKDRRRSRRPGRPGAATASASSPRTPPGGRPRSSRSFVSARSSCH